MQWLCQWPFGPAMAQIGHCLALASGITRNNRPRFREPNGQNGRRGETGVTVQVYGLDTRNVPGPAASAPITWGNT
ncbi:conserved hypothetical protein [Cupriavidus taiwanensis]|uniref:Uncharacterized protein n=1 Tax=Cupriavidus taiwanensis TaxID=164546 RepID=A0A976A9Z3_9BURK|nr:conserved hypothetical protein [Cupriavidus taiwanensis]